MRGGPARQNERKRRRRVERQWRAGMAGLRTNALVSTGATLFVLYSVAIGNVGSPIRVAS
ncbi:MgtC/SapB family protein [Streptomyces sp. TP-A0356]|uniref:MgtC/SapB family protein n=1 Tax=Streptomyces sp. TP-A0356 TaxID=1359208 RepID=UPI001F36803A|nr:MgtC/SapB family protein [Streptomyces sp. TP-A0356]